MFEIILFSLGFFLLGIAAATYYYRIRWPGRGKDGKFRKWKEKQMKMDDRIDTQSAEFDAIERLTKAWKALQMTPIVDDDYPEMRHYYESALHKFLSACKENGRTI